MIISPPFLPPRPVNQIDAEWVDFAMSQPAGRAPGTSALEGSFPVSASLMWHNGVHIQAPREGAGYASVRAVADGQIIFAKAGTKPNTDPADPQNYSPEGPQWSDNGIVIIRHSSEIGASNNAAATPTSFTFYSLYMHLSELAVAEVKSGNKPLDIRRKAPLGKPGCIYSHPGQIHFEISCDTDSLRHILNRAPGWQEHAPAITPTADGRTDVVFGSTFIYLSASTPTSVSRPTTHVRTPRGGASAATDHVVPNTLQEPLWVEIRYERGDSILRSYDCHGIPIGTSLRNPDSMLPNTLRKGQFESDNEYNLYKQATDRHKSLDAATQASSSPSGWYELLRFGRNLGHGTGRDPLPANAAHWRRIPTATGSVWADLNAQGSFKFSDADFLPVASWNCYDDDPKPMNQLCESYRLRRLLRDPQATHGQAEKIVESEERRMLAKRLGASVLRRSLRRVICKFPSEWDQNSIEARHQWLRTQDEGYKLETPSNWEKFVKHLKSMSFSDLPAAYIQANWRFHPTEFIAFFRQCGWFSESELAQIYSESIYKSVNKTSLEYKNIYRLPINRAFRKYSLNTPERAAHFFGQAARESYYFMIVREISVRTDIAIRNNHISIQPEHNGYLRITPSNSTQLSYFSNTVKYEGNKILGNTDAGDGIKFRGRGMKQLTGRFNYSMYWIYRGWLSISSYDKNWFLKPGTPGPIISDPQLAGDDSFSAVDTACYYCVTHQIPAEADAGISEATSNAVSRRVNPGEKPPSTVRWNETKNSYSILGDE
ncbi:M23 family metallopeptidase [Acidovorax cavernicola]|uniref:M23 family metallopeptidase n=1 Tax=Acidovorax cavernicola TaxID=1675792 RepID=UPI0011C439DC|nr:M23 family metallopeptidase [Acidovorax cavernicola]